MIGENNHFRHSGYSTLQCEHPSTAHGCEQKRFHRSVNAGAASIQSANASLNFSNLTGVS